MKKRTPIVFIMIVREGHDGILTWLGRHVATRGPGLVFLYPFFDRLEKIDIRIRTFEIDQECITRDDVLVTMKAVVHTHIYSATRILKRFKIKKVI